MPVFALQRSPAGATPFCRDPRIRQIRRDGEAPLATAGPTMHPIAADPNNLARVLEVSAEADDRRWSRGAQSSTSSRPLRRRELLSVLGERPGVLHGRRASSVRAPPAAEGAPLETGDLLTGAPAHRAAREGDGMAPLEIEIGGQPCLSGFRPPGGNTRRRLRRRIATEEKQGLCAEEEVGRDGEGGGPQRRRRCVAIRHPHSGKLEAVIRPPPRRRRCACDPPAATASASSRPSAGCAIVERLCDAPDEDESDELC
jgi:hypothetical protein